MQLNSEIQFKACMRIFEYFTTTYSTTTLKDHASIVYSVSRHTVVCRTAQKNGARANGVSILTETTKSRFSRIRSSVIPHPNGTKFTVELASTQGRPDFKF